jgi:ribosomal protein L17
MALRSRPVALRRIADKLLDKAEQGDLAAAREVIDRTDGKAIQATDYGDLSPRRLTDEQLLAIAAGALTEKDVGSG